MLDANNDHGLFEAREEEEKEAANAQAAALVVFYQNNCNAYTY